MEDAALVRPESGSPLVLTVDFITPIVDGPEEFGAIAAANALSDVYAMGGKPQVALAVCGFPDDRLGTDILERIFRGGRDKAAEAGCAIVGGHTVIDPELKYGLCVVGSVDAERALAQDRAQPGDRLVLSKPLGTGVAAQALKDDQLAANELELVVRVMSTLNRDACDAALAAGVHAATDVTGFGLLGHLYNLLLASGVAGRVSLAALPLFPFARRLVDQGLVPGGTRRNLAYVEPHTTWSKALGETDRLLACDAQTSGGLLMAVPEAQCDALLRELEARGTPAAAVIGEIAAGTPGAITVD
jgi:selenide,water dikinase